MADTEDTNIQQNFDAPDETRPIDKGRVEIVQVGDLEIMRATFEPGWSWSECVRPIAGGDSCQVAHKWYVVSGRMRMKMDDGTEIHWRAGDVGVVPPGHDAWVEGDEPFVFIDFEGGDTFAKPQG
jgi:mannose-6-phosphate isomerase-like protein (cupin superfamily)